MLDNISPALEICGLPNNGVGKNVQKKTRQRQGYSLFQNQLGICVDGPFRIFKLLKIIRKK
jgi:hypothetical protein